MTRTTNSPQRHARPSRPDRTRRRRVPHGRILAATVAAVVVAGIGPAWAYWTATASASATAGAATLAPPAAASVETVAGLTSNTITVTAAPAGVTPAAYRISRGGTIVCTKSVGEACTDTGLAPGTSYTYSVQSLLQQWVSTSVNVTVQTATLPAPAKPQLTAATDTGATGDGFTSNPAPAFTGTAQPGATVTLYLDGSAVGPTATADGSGAWTITPAPAPSTNLTHPVRVTQTLNGVRSAKSAALSLLIDTVSPATGTATTSCSVALTNGFCHGATVVTVTGLSDASPSSGLAGLDYSIAGGISGTDAISKGTAKFSFTAPDGNPTVTFTSRDVAGNRAVAGTVTPTDSMDNTAPTISSLVLDQGITPDGNAGQGDTVAIGFSDPVSGINPASFCSNWTTATPQTVSGNGVVTVKITDNVLSVRITGTDCGGTFHLGKIALGASYASGTATFSGNGADASTLSWVGAPGNTSGTLTIQLGAAQSGTLTPVTGDANPVLTPSTAISDLAGNHLSTATYTGTSSRF